MELNTGKIRDLIQRELKKVTTEKKTRKHVFTNKNKYTSRSITFTIDKETTEQDIVDNLGKAVNYILIDDINTTYVTKRQKYNPSDEAYAFHEFSTFKYDNFYLMYHITPVDTVSFDKVTIDDELVKSFKEGTINKKDFLRKVGKERTEVNLTLTIMYEKTDS